jgi:hypothetical protein
MKMSGESMSGPTSGRIQPFERGIFCLGDYCTTHYGNRFAGLGYIAFTDKSKQALIHWS